MRSIYLGVSIGRFGAVSIENFETASHQITNNNQTVPNRKFQFDFSFGFRFQN